MYSYFWHPILRMSTCLATRTGIGYTIEQSEKSFDMWIIMLSSPSREPASERRDVRSCFIQAANYALCSMKKTNDRFHYGIKTSLNIMCRFRSRKEKHNVYNSSTEFDWKLPKCTIGYMYFEEEQHYHCETCYEFLFGTGTQPEWYSRIPLYHFHMTWNKPDILKYNSKNTCHSTAICKYGQTQRGVP